MNETHEVDPGAVVSGQGGVRRWWQRRRLRALAAVALVLAAGAAVWAQQSPPPFCYQASTPICRDTLEQAEQAMRAAPENAAIASQLEQAETDVLSGTGNADFYFRVKDQPATVIHGPSFVEMQSTGGIVSTMHGCTPGNDPNLPTACLDEQQLLANVVQELRDARPDCSHAGPTLEADRIPPYAAIDARNNVFGGSTYGLIDYGFKAHKVVRTCNGTPATFIIRIFRHETFSCAPGYRRRGDAIANDGIGDLAVPVLCEYTGAARRITGPIQQCASCAASDYPVYPATGEKARTEPDFDFAGRTFTRYYHSLRQFRNNPGFAVGWTHTFSDRVSGTNGTLPAAVIDETGVYEGFEPIGNNRLRGANSVDSVLEYVPTGSVRWRLRLPDGEMREFDANRLLTAVRDGDDPRLDVVLGYRNGLLATATDGQGRVLRFEYSGAKLLTRIVLPDGTAFAYGYDADRNLISVDDGTGRVRRYHYAEAGLIGDASQRNHLTGITAETGRRFAAFRYDARGRVIESRAFGAPDDVTTVVYDSDTQATVTSAANEQRVYTIQPGLYRRITGVRTAGEPTQDTQTYDAQGRLQRSTDRRGVHTDVEYHASGAYRSATVEAVGTPEQRREEIVRDPVTHRVTERRLRDAAGALQAQTQWTYNARGQRLTETDTDPATGATRTTTTTYCEAADVTAGTCPLVGLVRSLDGARDNATDAADLTRFEYRADDAPGCATAPTTCAYRKGDLWKVIDATGQITEVLAYDGAGRVRSVRDATGVVTDAEYDPRGWLTATKVRGSNDASESDDRIERIAYTADGLVERVTGADGVFVRFRYDDARRLTAMIDRDGNTLTYTLDGAGRRIREEIRDAGGALRQTLSRSFDARGRLLSETDADGRSTTYAYDAEGNLLLTTDPLLRRTGYEYDALGRLRSVLQDVDGVAALAQFDVDALDRPTRIVDPNGRATTYTYNGFGDPILQNSPDTGQTGMGYTASGELRTRTDARGITATTAYDALDRPVSVAYPDSSRNVGYAYDSADDACQNGERFAKGRLGRMTDSSGSTVYCYDRYGQLARKVQTTQGRSYALRYLHTDPRGRLPGQDTALQTPPPGNQFIGMTYPDGSSVRIVRDAQARPTELRVTLANGTSRVLLHGATHHPFGPVAQWTLGNGRTLRRTLDRNGRPGIVEDPAPGGISEGYRFDAAGNLIALRRADQADPAKRTYAYDGLDRLTHVRDGATTALLQQYAYDATGNRTRRSDGATATDYTYAPGSHRLASVGEQDRQYDAVGNTLWIGAAAAPAPAPGSGGGNGDGEEETQPGDPGPGPILPPGGETQSATFAAGVTRTFAYDAANRLQRVSHGGVEAMRYLYNGHGERVHKAGGGVAITTVYDEDGRWIGDYDGNGQPLQQAIWLDDLPVGLLVGTGAAQKLYYLEADALGTPRVAIDPDRNVAVWTWNLANEAFGDSAPNEDPDGDGQAFVLDMRFPGQRYDRASGLVYNYYRDYDPTTGRYVQSDPIGLEGGMSTYGYADGSPMLYGDPDGLFYGFLLRMAATRLLPRLGVNFAARGTARAALMKAKREAQRRAFRAAKQTPKQPPVCSSVSARRAWRVGDDVYASTAKGRPPSWSTVRSRFWKNESRSPDAAKKYGAENVERMARGRAPQRYNPDKGGRESMELSHEPIPARDGGKDFVPRWPQDHAAVDPFRRPGY